MTAELTPDDLARMRVWLEGVADELRVNPNDAFTPDAMAALSADAVRLLDEVERLRELFESTADMTMNLRLCLMPGPIDWGRMMSLTTALMVICEKAGVVKGPTADPANDSAVH